MHPNIAVLLSVTCYATAAVVLEQQLSRFSAPLMVATVGAVVCMLALATHLARSGMGPENYPIAIALVWILAGCIWLGTHLTQSGSATLSYPVGAPFAWLLFACVLWYFADMFYMVAYTNGGNLYTITLLGTLFVPMAAVIRFVATHEMPTRYHVIAYATGCVMVWLTVYGNQHIGK